MRIFLREATSSSVIFFNKAPLVFWLLDTSGYLDAPLCTLYAPWCSQHLLTWLCCAVLCFSNVNASRPRLQTWFVALWRAAASQGDDEMREVDDLILASPVGLDHWLSRLFGTLVQNRIWFHVYIWFKKSMIDMEIEVLRKEVILNIFEAAEILPGVHQ